jgi:Flp pilus assembly protein TadD
VRRTEPGIPVRDDVAAGRAKADRGAALMALAPDHAAAWLAEANVAMARALRNRGDDAAAAAALEQAIALAPDLSNAHSSLGMVLKDLGRLDDALRCHRRALALDPRNAAALTNLGTALHACNAFDAAIAAHRQAIVLAPDRVEPHSNLARLLHDLGRIDEARSLHERAVACDPTNATARFNRATAMLLDGDLAGGFAEYEVRRRHGVLSAVVRRFDMPEWQGESLAGRTILLHAEQGVGDTLQFVRFVPAVAAVAAAVVLQVQTPLVTLLAQAFPGVRVVAAGEAVPSFDCHLPLMSLPFRLGTTLATLPADVPYLFAASRKLAAWRAPLAGRPGLKVGLVWAGNPGHRFDRRRSIALAALLAPPAAGRRRAPQPAEGASARGTCGARRASRHRRPVGLARRFFRHGGGRRGARSDRHGRQRGRASRRRAGAADLAAHALRARLALAAGSRRQPVVPDPAADPSGAGARLVRRAGAAGGRASRGRSPGGRTALRRLSRGARPRWRSGSAWPAASRRPAGSCRAPGCGRGRSPASAG